VTKPLPTKPGINGANVLSIPTEWDATWFRKFINNSLKGADVRNAIAGPGIAISGTIASPYATISATGVSGGVSQIVAGTGITVSPAGGTGVVTVNATGSGGGVTTVSLNDTSTAPIYTTAPTTAMAGAVSETITLKTQTANTLFAGPATGAAAQPTFRDAVFADISSAIPNFNITPDTHPAVPTGVGVGPNDEFEAGAAIDTTGTRYTGATAWSGFNVGVAPIGISNSVSQGSLLILAGATQAGVSLRGYSQPLAGPTSSTYIAKVQSVVVGSSSSLLLDAGLFLSESSTGKAVTLDVRVSNTGSEGNILVTSWTSPLVAVSNLATVNLIPSFFSDGSSTSSIAAYSLPIYLQLVIGTTTISCSSSRSGVAGTFTPIVTFNKTAQFTVAPDTIGLYINPDILNGISAGIFDWFRRVA
jgi:hypothetical protein